MSTFTPMATLGSLIGLNPVNDSGRKLEHPHKHKENTERCRQGELTGKNDIIRVKTKLMILLNTFQGLDLCAKPSSRVFQSPGGGSGLQRPVRWL